MSDLDECLKAHKTAVDSAVKWELENEACVEEVELLTKTIQGKNSAITTAQRERDEARAEAQNYKDEVSRLQDELLICQSEKQSLSVSNKKLQENYDKLGREVAGYKTRIAELETENRELKKSVVEGLSASELLRLAILKFLRLDR